MPADVTGHEIHKPQVLLVANTASAVRSVAAQL